MLPLLSLVSLVSALPSPQIDADSGAGANSPSIPISTNTIPFTARVPISAVRHNVKLDRLERVGAAAAANWRKGNGKGESGKGGDKDTLLAPGGASEYALDITIGNQKLSVVADTGSSDLWTPVNNFTCLNINNTVIPLSNCSFGPNYFSPSSSSSFHKLDFANNFNISYGDGTNVFGYGGNDTVTIGNLVVKGVEMGVATQGYWQGDNVTNGLIGLANPLITDIFYGTNGSRDALSNEAEYDPWFYQAVKEGLVDPYFSLVINRPTLAFENTTNTISNLGSITFGGIPSSSSVPVTSTTVTVPNHKFSVKLDNKTVSQTEYYTLAVDSFNFPGSASLDTRAPLTILDSGTTLIYVPDAVSNALNAHWSPQAQYSDDEGAFIIDCDAKAPWFSVTIGGKTFTTTRDDLIYPSETQPGKCISSVLRGGSNVGKDVFILGDRFLVNVISTFNIQNNEITVTQRQNYTATS